MSCLRRTLPAIRAAAAAGIGRLGSLIAFFRPPQKKPETPAALPVLAALNRVEPLRPAARAGRVCRSCGGRSDERRGNWFEIAGGSYCRDCAPAAAQAAGLSLGGTPPRSRGKNWRDAPVPTTLEPATVRVNGVRVEGLAVHAGGRASGLSLVPEVKTTARGVAVDRTRWFVSYDRGLCCINQG